MTTDPSRCPICQQPNDCTLLSGQKECWCFKQAISPEILDRVPVSKLNSTCICQRCANSQASST
ncbi:MAG: cysteine-rich CWC family protein [Candidatus Eremiobacteraeota bacterium]|nr:cysteine-rich CWC family protein [Candidatus Eremiobacteraeota bacterium]